MYSTRGEEASASPIKPLHHRPDIDGLRTVAVLAVVAYHAFPNKLRGGLIGVDIFFVISGFLITSIILRALHSGRFSFVDFYLRRVRRIFPALALVLGSCLIAGWFLLYDVEYRPLAEHIAGGAAFVSNFILSSESGYFDSQSDYKELLHLWSLGVEEQFYLLFPLGLFLCRRNTRASLWLTLGLLIASFGCNIWLTDHGPTQAYYSPVSRFWELMIGAALAHVSLGLGSVSVQRASQPESGASLYREACAWTGVALIAIGLGVIDDSSAFPGWLALLPTVGALLVLSAGPGARFNRYILSTRPMVFLGLISYPLYLWHWPLLSFARVLSPEAPSRTVRALIVCLSVVLAWGTYRLLELPIRRLRVGWKPALALSASMAVIGSAGLLIMNADGFPQRAANAQNGPGHELFLRAARENDEIRHHRFQTQRCPLPPELEIEPDWCEQFGDESADLVVLWGDSHAAAWAPAFYEIASRRHLRVMRFSVGGCPPLLQTRRIDAIFADAPCGEFGFAEHILKAIELAKPTHVFLLARWSLYTRAKLEARGAGSLLRGSLDRTLDALPRQMPVTLFRTAPVIRNEPQRALLRHTNVSISTAEYAAREARANGALDAIARTHPNVSIFSPQDLYCTQTCDVTRSGTVLYANATHLSAQGALLAVDSLSELFGSAMLAHDSSAGLP